MSARPAVRQPSGVRYSALTVIWVGAMAVGWWPLVLPVRGPAPLRHLGLADDFVHEERFAF